MSEKETIKAVKIEGVEKKASKRWEEAKTETVWLSHKESKKENKN